MKKTELYTIAIDIIKSHHTICEETVEPLKIGTMSYSPADAWLSLDPIAYRESLLGFADVVLTENEDYKELTAGQRTTIDDALADYGGTAESIRFALMY